MIEEPTFTIPQAATLVRCAPTTLRDRCTRGEVPHHRRHRVRGIYFTQLDIEAIISGQARSALEHDRHPDELEHSPELPPKDTTLTGLQAALAVLGGPGRTRSAR